MTTLNLACDVVFPNGKTPFASQIAVISNVLQALNLKQNALLESPTGTGKTLALLTGTIHWQRKEYELIEKEREQLNDNKNSHSSNEPYAVSVSGKSPRRRQIFYCSRTHSQLQQVIEELKSCHHLEDIRICILGSRAHMCNNKSINSNHIITNIEDISNDNNTFHKSALSLDEKCRKLQEQHKCPYAFNAFAVADALQQDGVWDIEDAMKIGTKHRGCVYYATRSLLTEAHIVFAPYNYLLDANIRKTMNINLEGAIIVFDEAHNIEDVARSAASAEITRNNLNIAVLQLRVLASTGVVAFKSLLELLEKLLLWLDKTYKLLQSMDMKSDENIWHGEEAAEILEIELGLDINTLPIYEEYFKTVMHDNDNVALLLNNNDNNDDNNDTKAIQYEEKANEAKLSSTSCSVVKSLLLTARYMLGRNKMYLTDYKLVIQQNRDRFQTNNNNSSNNTTTSNGIKWDFSLNIWCLNAAVSFADLNEQCHSLLLTSGTLSPLDSFAKELGIPFPVIVQAEHVIDVRRQLWTGAIATCGDFPLLATYTNHNNHNYHDAVGKCVQTVATVTPGGVLVFFPSYSLLEKVYTRWMSTGLIQTLMDTLGCEMFTEPRNSKDLMKTMELYNSAIETVGKGILIAVCRGKISEGIDFSDRYARAVLVIGIPFASTKDLYVSLKKKHQSEKFKKDTKHCDGEQWYCQQAFRAINQAFGRCIRHRKDYGAILLCDPRFHRNDVKCHLSQWMRSSITNYNHLEESIVSLRTFFREMETAFPGTTPTATAIPVPVLPIIKNEILKKTRTPLSKLKLKLNVNVRTQKEDITAIENIHNNCNSFMGNNSGNNNGITGDTHQSCGKGSLSSWLMSSGTNTTSGSSINNRSIKLEPTMITANATTASTAVSNECKCEHSCSEQDPISNYPTFSGDDNTSTRIPSITSITTSFTATPIIPLSLIPSVVSRLSDVGCHWQWCSMEKDQFITTSTNTNTDTTKDTVTDDIHTSTSTSVNDLTYMHWAFRRTREYLLGLTCSDDDYESSAESLSSSLSLPLSDWTYDPKTTVDYNDKSQDVCIREVWNAVDGVVYRLLMLNTTGLMTTMTDDVISNYGNNNNNSIETDNIVVAVKIIAVTKNKTYLTDRCWIQSDVASGLLNSSSSSSNSTMECEHNSSSSGDSSSSSSTFIPSYLAPVKLSPNQQHQYHNNEFDDGGATVSSSHLPLPSPCIESESRPRLVSAKSLVIKTSNPLNISSEKERKNIVPVVHTPGSSVNTTTTTTPIPILIPPAAVPVPVPVPHAVNGLVLLPYKRPLASCSTEKKPFKRPNKCSSLTKNNTSSVFVDNSSPELDSDSDSDLDDFDLESTPRHKKPHRKPAISSSSRKSIG
eukprot:gene1956-3796_t